MFGRAAANHSRLPLRALRPNSFRMLSSLTSIKTVNIAPPARVNIVRFEVNTSYYSTKVPAIVRIATYEEVKDLPSHPEKLLIDVREPDELKEFGVIPTSINIPLGSVQQELSLNVKDDVFEKKYRRKKPAEDTEIIFHCRLGKRSAKAAETAVGLGYSNVKNYEGSWIDWAEHEGLPK